MPAVLDQLSSLVSSIFHTITSAFGSIIAVIQSIFATIFSLIGTAFDAVETAIKGVAQTFEGLLKFLFSNIVVIGALIAAFFAYTVYQQRNGRGVTSKPAIQKKSQ